MYILDIFYERSNSLPSKIKREHTEIGRLIVSIQMIKSFK